MQKQEDDMRTKKKEAYTTENLFLFLFCTLNCIFLLFIYKYYLKFPFFVSKSCHSNLRLTQVDLSSLL